MANQNQGVGGFNLGVVGGDLLNTDLLDLNSNDSDIGLKDLMEQAGRRPGLLPSSSVDIEPIPSGTSGTPAGSLFLDFQNPSLTSRQVFSRNNLSFQSVAVDPPQFNEIQFDPLSGVANPQAQISEDGFVLQLTFDEIAGNIISDTSPDGASNDGALRNGAVIQSSPEFGSNVLYLEGGDDYLAIADSPDINLEKHAQRTMSVWFRLDELGETGEKQVIYEEGGTTRGLNIYTDGSQLYVGGWNRKESNWEGTYLSTDAIQADTWHHVTVVLDAEPNLRATQAGAFSAYLDGTKFGEGEGSQLWKHGSNIGVGGVNQATRFHDEAVGGSGKLGLQGSIGEIRLYNRVLDESEISVLATPNPDTGLSVPALEDVSVHYRLDEQTGSQAKDLAFEDGRQAGNLQNGATFRLDASPLGGVVDFDGVDDYVKIQDSPEINLGENAERTVSTWFKLNTLGSGDRKQVIYEEGGGVRGLNIYVDNGQLYVGGWNRREGNWTGTYLSTDGIQTDTWHHVSLVLDAEVGVDATQAGAFRAYLDGEQFGAGDGQQLWQHPNNVGLGAIHQKTRFHDGVMEGTGTQGLNGSIGDFQLYNRALNAVEIQTLATLPGASNVSINLALAEDTAPSGQTNTDGITSNPEITGVIESANQLSQVFASFSESNDGSLTEITSLIQPSGQFVLSESELIRIFGAALTDGDYTLNLFGLNESNQVVAESQLRFTLDRSAPELELYSPLAGGAHSLETRLLGWAFDPLAGIASSTYGIDTENPIALEIGPNGQLNTALEATEGLHQVTVSITDLAGNVTQTQLDFTVDASAVGVGSATNSGWGGKTNDALILGEQGSSFTQATLDVELGQNLGSRTLSFDVNAVFDQLDADGVGDRLLVYLVDPTNPSQTLLDQGVAGSPVFELTETGANFQAGLVRYNGTTVEIDVTSLEDEMQGQLIFQLLNNDGDTGSIVQVGNLSSTVDEAGVESPVFPMRRTVSPVGSELDLSNLSSNSEIAVQLSKVQFDPTTGLYSADLQVVNNGDAVSRQMALVFEYLPEGVTLRNPSGVDANGNPYLNVSPSIQRGGLDSQAISDAIALEIDNPNQVQFDWQVTVLSGGANQAPVFDAVTIPDILPGGVFKLPLEATDPNGDRVTYSIRTEGDLPTGKLNGNGILEFRPSPEQVGSYTFTLVASDGALETTQEVTVNVVPDPVTTTRVSGIVENVDQEPLVGVVVEIGNLITVTDENGAFTIESDGPLPDDTLKVRGEGISGDEIYPFIPEKLVLMLGHEAYEGVNNVIDRPIYLPALDVESGQTVDPFQTVTVTTANIPGAAVTVEAGSLLDQEGNAFSGVLSITEVPRELTPAALPKGINPDLVVTIQPGEMVFDTPARLSLPNTAGYAPGLELELWSINPNTGDFDNVGVGRVSADGSVIETIEGGIRNSSWHFFIFNSRAIGAVNLGNNTFNQDNQCPCSPETVDANSEIELHSGALTENHNLVSYQSLGQSRGFSLVYDSLRADPQPIVNFGYDSVNIRRIASTPELLRLVGKLTFKTDDFDYQVPGFEGGQYGLSGGEHIWKIPADARQVSAALQADLRFLSTGKYSYSLETGAYLFQNNQFTGSSTASEGEIIHVNGIGNIFGNGWGLAGLQELIENPDGTILLIDGDGSEMLFDAPANGESIYGSPPADFSVFEKLADGTFQRTMKDQTVYRFNPNHQLASVTDRNNNETRFLYNDQNQIIRVIDPVGLETAFAYANDRVSQITDPAGKVTLLEHDIAGNLIKVTDPDGTSRTWEYDSDFHMTSEVDKRGNREQSYYNFAGRAIRSTRKDGTQIQVDPLQLQGLRKPEETTNPLLAPTTFALDKAETTHVDGNGNVITSELNQVGQVVSSSDGQGRQPALERNSQNLVTRNTDSRGNHTNLVYDDRGNVIRSSDTFASNVPNFEIPIREHTSDLFNNPVARVNSGTEELKAVDLNNDGILDLVNLGSFSNGRISLLFGDENGHYSGPDYLDLSTVHYELFTQDLNQDGNVDLLAVNNEGLTLFFNDGTGHFSAPTVINPLTQDGSVDSIVLSDLNGDGALDISLSTSIDSFGGGYGGTENIAARSSVVIGFGYGSETTTSSHQLLTYINQGDGSFAENAAYELSNAIDSLTALDLNGDNLEDLVAIGGFGFEVATYLSDGIGNLTLQQNYRLEESMYLPLHSDLNLDGQMDLILSSPGFGERSGRIFILFGNGDGSFTQTDAFLNQRYSAIELVDLNNDGYDDLLTGNSAEGETRYYLNQGDGTFGDPTSFFTDGNLRSIFTGDLNGDSLNDFVTYSYTGVSQSTYPGDYEIVSFLNFGDEGFIRAIQYPNVALSPYKLQDIDLDGALDLLGRGNQYGGELIIAQGNNDGGFNLAPRTIYLRGNEPIAPSAPVNGITTGLINDDLLPDIVSVDYRYDRVYVDGIRSLTTGSGPVAVAVGDIDGNGYQDIAVANALDDSVNIFFNESGTINPVSTTYQVGNSPSDIALADIDGDGALDLFVANSADTVSIFTNNGDGSFADAIDLSVNNSVHSIELGDINSDGLLDVVAANNSSGLSVFENQGDGTFLTQAFGPSGYRTLNYPVSGASLTLGDVNLDGYLDAVTTLPNSQANQVLLWINQGDGSFANAQSLEVGRSPHAVELGDIDNDGNLDIVSINNRDSSATVLFGDGQGNFLAEKRRDFGIGTFVGSLALDDLDRDGDLDFVTHYFERNLDSNLIYNSTPFAAQNFFRRAGFVRRYKGLNNLISGGASESYESFFQPSERGNYRSFTYDSVFNQLTSSTNELGQRILYTIDSETGNRLSERQVVGLPGGDDDLVTHYTYNERGQIDTMRDPLGRLTDYEYNNLGRLVQITEAISTTDEASVSFEYDAAGNQTAIIDENGNRTEFIYDPLNRLTRMIEADPDGDGPLASPVTVYIYDEAGNEISMTDARSHQTQYTYDELNRLTVIQDPLLGKTTYTYDEAGNIIESEDELGRITKYQYDSRNRLISAQDPEGFVTRYNYDVDNNLIQIVDPLGNQTAFEYDARNRVVRETDAHMESVLFTYDAADNLISQTDKNGNKTEFAYDDINRLILSRNALGDISKFEYDLASNLVASTDELGRVTRSDYDQRDRLTSMTDPLGGVMSYTYDGVGNMLSYTDELDRTTTYEYDALNRQISVTDPLNFTTQYEYDSVDNLTAITDALGRRTSYEYDELNRQVKITNALGDSMRMTYDAVDNVIALEDELGRVTTFTYDGRDLQISTTDALEQTSRSDYDAVGNVISVTDELGRVISIEYDALYRQIKITDAIGGKTAFAYDAVGNLLSSTDELNRTTSYDYDELYRQIAITDPLNHTTTYEYDAVDNLVGRTDALGRTTSYDYDNLDRLVQQTNALGDTVKTTYDAVDNVVAVEDELGRVTTFAYDERDLRTSVTDALGHTTQTAYDAIRNVISTTDALGHITTYGYDELYRQTRVTDAIGASTLYTYDAVGNLLSLTDPESNTTAYTYDVLNRLVTDTHELGGTRSYVYDAVDNEIEMTDRNGRVVQYEYDDLNRRTTEKWLDSDDTVIRTFTSTYDAASQLTAISDPDSSYSYIYDLAGRLTSVDNAGTPGVPNVLLTYEYDDVNNMTGVTDTIDGVVSGIESYTYDDLDRVVQLTQSGVGVADKRVDFDYDAASQMIGSTRYASLLADSLVVQSDYVYDLAGRLTSLKHRRGDSGSIADYQWQYDAANRITQFTSVDGVSDYNYDDRNQLTASDHSYQENEAYVYDDNGNRINTGYQTGLNNRLLSDGVYTYAYDGEGNRTQRTLIATGEVDLYEWDHRNRLTRVVTQDSSGNVIKSVDYAYDVGDRRIEKTVDADGDGAGASETERFVYDGDHISLVFDGEGNQTHRYFHGPQIDQVLAEETADGTVRWSLADNQGTIRDVIDNDGNVLNHVTYDSFGQITRQTNSTAFFRFGYTGREFDTETGQYFYRARYFDASNGRFISEDPIGFAAGDANLSRYVFNSPLNYVDPSGNVVESGWDLLSLTVGVASFTHNVARGDVKGAVIDGFGIAADTAALLLPGVPGGAGAARNAGKVSQLVSKVNNLKWIKRGTDAFKTSKRVRNVVRGAQGANLLANIYQTADSGLGAYQKWLESCGTEVPWGEIAQTGLNGLGILGSASSLFRSLKPFEDVCFVAGTLVLTTKGKKAIDELRPGDWVLSWDEETGEISERAVTEYYQREVPRIFDIFIGIEKISCSAEHPFWVEGKGWVLAHQLKPGAVLKTRDDESLVIDEIHRRDEVTQVFNIEIDGSHTYFVSELEILSHNVCGRPDIREYDIAPYKDFDARSVTGDNIEGHELLQHAWLKDNGYATRRLKGNASRDNPVIALPKTLHKDVNSAQKGMSISSQNARQNIEANRRILLDAGIDRMTVNHLTRRAVQHAQNLGVL